MSWQSGFLSLRGKIQQEHNHSLKRKHKQTKQNTKPVAYSQSNKCFFWFLFPSSLPSPLSKHCSQWNLNKGATQSKQIAEVTYILWGERNSYVVHPEVKNLNKTLQQMSVKRKHSLKAVGSYLHLPVTWFSHIRRTRPSRVYCRQRYAAWRKPLTSAAARQSSSFPGSLPEKGWLVFIHRVQLPINRFHVYKTLLILRNI